MICISIGKEELFPAVNALKPDLVEIRYDLMAVNPEEVQKLLDPDIRQVATCRPGRLSNQQRTDILKRAIGEKAAYVDIELESPIEMINELKAYTAEADCSLIVSYHNFETTPTREALMEIEASCYTKGADVAKLACMVRNAQDNANLLSLYAASGRKVIIGMGEEGRITRIAAEALGAEFTFVSVSEKESTAPGQLTYNAYLAIKENA